MSSFLMAGVLLCVSVIWPLYAFFGHRIITAMYEGRAIWFFNRIIEGQANSPVEFYLKAADSVFTRLGIAVILVLFFLICIKLFYKYKTGRWSVILLIYFTAAFIVLDAFMTSWEFKDTSQKLGFNQVMVYAAHRPYAYRILMPKLVNFSSSLFPEDTVNAHKDWLTQTSPVIRYAKMKNFSDTRISFKYHLTYLYLYICLILLLFSMRSLTKLIYSFPCVVSDFAPAVGLCFLPLTFLQGRFIYDFPELLFMGFCLICLFKRRWLLYYALFFLAILNKESNALLVLFFAAICRGSLPRKSFMRHLAAQMLIGVVTVGFLWYIFAGNPGVIMQNHLKDNMRYWLQPKSYFLLFDPYYLGQPLFPYGANIISLVFFSFLIFYKWKNKPLTVKRLFVYACAVNIPLFLYACYRDELRNLSFIFPSIYLLGVHSVYSLIRGRLFQKDKQPQPAS